MIVRELSPEQLEPLRPLLLRFMKRHGDGRITHRAMHWLSRLKPEEMRGGTLIAATMHERRITGMIVFGNYGLSESFIAVHPEFRRKGVGETLLRHALSRLKKVYTRVAFDNIPSLKLCFACGLSAFHIVKGPTGKPTLWLGGGTFDPSEVSKETEHIKEMGSP